MNVPETYSSWEDLTDAFKLFPDPRLGFDSEAEPDEALWVFRGHKCANYDLVPRIERECAAKPDWAMIEFKILEEFQSLARLHLNPSEVPKPEDKLSWLALMQHHGVPTRLLDFTFSPFVALYFAITKRSEEERQHPPQIWAIDARALMRVARQANQAVVREEKEHALRNASIIVSAKMQGASLDPRFFSTPGDSLQNEAVRRRQMISDALSGKDIRRDHFNKNGFVAFAMPPIQNRRLSSQQGAFLFNGAEELSFSKSLSKMMNEQKIEWRRRFTITNGSLMDFERRLFQMNIHGLSLFPDIGGLAEFIAQKVRLHWVPEDNPLIE